MSSKNMNRRDVIKTAAAAGASFLLPSCSKVSQKNSPLPFDMPSKVEYQKPSRPVTAVVIGAGNRGSTYAGYPGQQKDEWKIVGVAEPIQHRNERMAQAHDISPENCFNSWEYVFEKPKLADVCVITTPDHLHYGPAMAALEKGYDLLLEKPIAQTWQECKDILNLAVKNDRIVAVCHVLRYTPYFRQLHHIVRSGYIGEIVSIQHLEPIEHLHMAHSFVRGNWRQRKQSNPIILSKSCHDLDILRWLIDKPCRKVSSFGSLKLFRKEMAPSGAPLRCTDGCPAEKECPFSACKIYLNRKERLPHLKLKDNTQQEILNALKTGPYGRCVYHCDNDVLDHQVTNLEFADGITASFSMEGLTSYGGRRTRIMGTNGDIVGDERFLDVYNFSTRKRTKWDVHEDIKVTSGHGGGDYGLMRDFVQAVSRQDASLLTSTLQASMESHLMGFMADKGRLTDKVMPVNFS